MQTTIRYHSGDFLTGVADIYRGKDIVAYVGRTARGFNILTVPGHVLRFVPASSWGELIGSEFPVAEVDPQIALWMEGE